MPKKVNIALWDSYSFTFTSFNFSSRTARNLLYSITYISLNCSLTLKIMSFIVRFQVLAAASMMFRVFWFVAPYSYVEGDWRYRGAYCLHHQGDETFITLMMEAVRTSVSSVQFNITTRRYIREESVLSCFRNSRTGGPIVDSRCCSTMRFRASHCLAAMSTGYPIVGNIFRSSHLWQY
jgi:hypothetical protein